MIRALLIVALMSGCGARALRAHMATAKASRTVLNGAAMAIQDTCTVTRLRELRAESVGRAIQFGERCEAAAASHRTAVSLWRAYVETAAAEGVDAVEVVSLLVRLQRVYGSVRTLVLSVGGRELPDLGVE